MEHDYYVYEHIRLDNNTCFYVGKGHGNRAYVKSRNEHHDRIAQKAGMKVNIVKDGLTEEEAYQVERELIQHYVFDLGYGIDIIRYNNKKGEIGHLTNHTFGGDGSFGMVHSEEWKKQHSFDMSGQNNPMYGVNVWNNYSEERANEIKEKISASSSGENNPMYNVSPVDRMDAQTYSSWLDKTKTRLASQTGANNPNYHNTTLRNKLAADPELKIQYYSRPGGQNGHAKKIEVFDAEYNFLKDFACVGDCCSWMKETFGIKAKVNSMRPYVIKAANESTLYKNLYFRFKK